MTRTAGEVGREGGRAMIGVNVTLFADMRRYLPPGVDGPHRRVVPAGSTVAELLAVIGIPADAEITVGVDGELADRATPLRDGADVMVLSPMEGGRPLPTEDVNQRRDGTPRVRGIAVVPRSPASGPASLHTLAEETP